MLFISKKEWFERNWHKLVIALLSVAMFMFMIQFSHIQSFWLDKLYQIGFFESSSNLKELISIYTKMIDSTAPLSPIIHYFWYNIVVCPH
jgi:hypothetical protein